MRIYDIIAKKRDGAVLTEAEIQAFVRDYTAGRIPDYQAAALLMAICIRGMTDAETTALTMAMRDSGEVIDLSAITGFKADKHSTGGVGDKTTPVVVSIAAAAGVKVAKMSGKGLAHTGGTVDKLDAIPGMNTALTEMQFFDIVNRVGCAVTGQTGNLVPADKKIYALRDVTGTVESIPLIAASILSKKLASGADGFVFDVTVGSGAFMKTLAEARHLATLMVRIAASSGKSASALLTDMDIPLGLRIGNILELQEVIEVLNGGGPADLRTVCIALAAEMIHSATAQPVDVCRVRAEELLDSGAAMRKFTAMVAAQGGDTAYLTGEKAWPTARHEYPVRAMQSGYVHGPDALALGRLAVDLGAGRRTKDAPIDYTAGIGIKCKRGAAVEAGDILGILYCNDVEDDLSELAEQASGAWMIRDEKPSASRWIYERITKDGFEEYTG
ncbi:MAG: thymidine phosphorylase [Eubacteriales bacterium]|nr:thymidine phosphorylase [Eubacteriales bacterium]